MTPDVIDTLAALNPVRTPPAVEGVERVLATIHGERRAASPGERRSRRTRGRGLIAGATILLAACALGLVLADGSSGPGVNVAAAAYQATSPAAGVLEVDFVDHLFDRRRLVAVVQRREWIDARAGSQRALRITRPAGRACASVILETASAPGHVEFASGAKACPRPLAGRGSVPGIEVIHRFDLGKPRPQEAGAAVTEPAPALTPAAHPGATVPAEVVLGAGRDACKCFSPTPAFQQGGGSPLETEGLGLYRRLYRAGVIHLAGRVRRGARLLWRLEGTVVWSSTNTRAGRWVPILGLVVLVDPTTFRPLVQQQINLALPDHPVTVESQLVGYRRLPRDAASEALLQISSQHPGLRVNTLPGR